MKKDNQGEQFTTMLYDRKHLIIETTNDRRVVIAETYLPENAALICRLLSEDAESKADNQSGVANQT